MNCSNFGVFGLVTPVFVGLWRHFMFIVQRFGRLLSPRLFKFLTLLLLGSMFSPGTAAAQVFVDLSSKGLNDGTSWDNAYDSLQLALDDPRSAVEEIWVAAGIYRPTRKADPDDNRSASFAINRDGIRLLGGFFGTEQFAEERDWQGNETVLTGFYPEEFGGPFRAYNVISVDGSPSGEDITNETFIDGFIVTQGHASGVGASANGGGLVCRGQEFDCAPTLSNLLFVGNWADGNGGALFIDRRGGQGVGEMLISDVEFANNQALRGGAVYNDGSSSGNSSVHLMRVRFLSNSAGQFGGAIYNDGSQGGLVTSAIGDSDFIGNTSGISGGAIYDRGGGSGFTDLSINLSSFLQNSSSFGGAVFVDGFNGETKATIDGTEFYQNSADERGGSVYSVTSGDGSTEIAVTNSDFLSSQAIVAGGAIFVEARSGSESLVRLEGSRISGNSAQFGGGLYLWGLVGGIKASLDRIVLESNQANFGGGMYLDGTGEIPSGGSFDRFVGDLTHIDGSSDWFTSTQGSVYPEIDTDIRNSLFVANHAVMDGGALYNIGDREGTSEVLLANTTLADNLAMRNGSALYSEGKRGGSVQILLFNSIVWENGAAAESQLFNLNSAPLISYSIVGGSGGSGASWNSAFGEDGGSNLDVDPLFEGLATTQTPGPTEFEYQLQKESPGIDAGDSSSVAADFDLLGNRRISGVSVDIGAIERPRYSVGGSVAGWERGPFNLLLNDSEVLGIKGNGPFTFQAWLEPGESYVVEFSPESSMATALCTISNPSGVIFSSDISDLAIECMHPVDHVFKDRFEQL